MGGGVDLGDFLAVAEAVTGIKAEDLLRATRVSLAESALAAPHAAYGGREFYPDGAQRAAILCSRIVRNHPLPDGNKRTGLLCMLLQLDRYGLTWKRPGDLQTAEMIERLAGGTLPEAEWVAWVQASVA
jgi:death on curing protein